MLKKRVSAILRVMAMSLGLLSIATAITLRQAEAKLAESLQGFFDVLAKDAQVSTHSAPRTLMVNGLALSVVSASTTLGVASALDRFQSLCHSVGQIDVPAAVKARLTQAEGREAPESLGVIRRVTESEGFVGCVDLGEGLTGEGFLHRVMRFTTTKNLRTLGQLRYVLARRSAGTTTLVMFWTEGDALLTEMFPKGGDAPGRELADLPRPKLARRLLSAFEQGRPNGVAVYRVANKDVDAVRRGYDESLRAEGWQIRPVQKDLTIAEKAGRRVLVRVSPGKGHQVTVSLWDLG